MFSICNIFTECLVCVCNVFVYFTYLGIDRTINIGEEITIDYKYAGSEGTVPCMCRPGCPNFIF